MADVKERLNQALQQSIEERLRRLGPPRRIRMSFSCNDPKNPRRACMAHIESLYLAGRHPWELELMHDDWGRGVAFTVDASHMRIRIHRQWFGFKHRIPYFGNMAWDAFDLERGTAKRLLNAMRRDGGWQCEAGTAGMCRWWDRTA